MRCFVCARGGSDANAVAICPRCGAGLCMTHVADGADDPGPGGMSLACSHGTWDRAGRQTAYAGRP